MSSLPLLLGQVHQAHAFGTPSTTTSSYIVLLAKRCREGGRHRRQVVSNRFTVINVLHDGVKAVGAHDQPADVCTAASTRTHTGSVSPLHQHCYECQYVTGRRGERRGGAGGRPVDVCRRHEQD